LKRAKNKEINRITFNPGSEDKENNYLKDTLKSDLSSNLDGANEDDCEAFSPNERAEGNYRLSTLRSPPKLQDSLSLNNGGKAQITRNPIKINSSVPNSVQKVDLNQTNQTLNLENLANTSFQQESTGK